MPVQYKGCERNVLQKLHAFMFNSVHKNTCKVVKKPKNKKLKKKVKAKK